ncbi:MAG: aminopeptidase [Candidatus Aenigmatarchaeota archaeon]
MKAIENAVKNAILLKPKEKVLIIYDKNKEEIAKLFYNECKKISDNIKLVKIKVAKQTRREPPQNVIRLMKKYDIILGITTISLTHTKAIRKARKNARIATMPDITRKMIPALNINYKKLQKICNKLSKYYKRYSIIKIKTKNGTNIKIKYDKREPQSDDGIMDHIGSLHNLPAGECGIAPLENGSNGRLVIDGAMVGVGVLKSPLIIDVENGKIINIFGKNANKLKNIFKKSDKNSTTIAEFSIGLNSKAKIIGNVLLDEKVMGTCHVAFGDNKSLGGKNKSNVHLDGIIKKPTIWFGKKLIMKNGKLII